MKLKKSVKKPNKENVKEIKYLKRLLMYTERAANGTSPMLDELFKAQAAKIRKQIKGLKSGKA